MWSSWLWPINWFAWLGRSCARTNAIALRSCGDNLKSLLREKEFLPGLLAENRDGNGSLPRSRNLISEKVFTRPSTLYGRGRADIHHGPESMTPLEGRIHWRRPTALIIFRLQRRGGPYIPITFLRWKDLAYPRRSDGVCSSGKLR